MEQNLNLVKVLGRTSKARPYALFWSGGRYEMNVRAANLSVTIKASFQTHEQWIVVLVDGALVIRMPLSMGENVIPILRNRNPEVTRCVRIIKESPVMPNDGDPYIELTGIETDGTLLPVPEAQLKLVFVGDSITSGEGGAGANGELDWVSQIFSAYDNYTYMTAEALGADYQCLSQSGWGVACGYDNDTRHNMTDHWERVCSIAYADGPERPAAGAEERYDFTAFAADAVIINLGTNDGNGFRMPPFTNPETGETFSMKKEEDGSIAKESAEFFTMRAVTLLSEIRCSYPNAKIVWLYGMLGYEMRDLIRGALLTYRQITGDAAPLYIEVPEAKEGSFGSRFHPGHVCHAQTAKLLSAELKAVLLQ